MYRAILEKDPPYPDDCSPQALAIMRACIERDPAKRLQDPKQIKAHPFFAGIDWEKLAAKELVPPYAISHPCWLSNRSLLLAFHSLTLKMQVHSAREEQGGRQHDLPGVPRS
jgi:hypothetical protein